MRPEIPPGLVHVLEKALAKDRTERFASAPELAEALAPFASTADSGGIASSVTIRQTASARPDAHTVATEVGANAASLAAPPDLSIGAGAAAISEAGGSIVSAPSSSSRSRLGLGALVLGGAVVVTAGFLSFRTPSRVTANIGPDAAAPTTVSTTASAEPTTETAATAASVTMAGASAPATSAPATSASASASASPRVTKRPPPLAPSVRHAASPSPSATSPIFFPQ